MPIYAFISPTELVVHLQVTVDPYRCDCTRVRTPCFPDDWKHQWSLECHDEKNSNYTCMDMQVRKARENPSNTPVYFWVRMKQETVDIDFPTDTGFEWPVWSRERGVLGEVIEIRLSLDGDFAYLAKKRRNQSTGQHFKKFFSKLNKTDVIVRANDGRSATVHWDALVSRSSAFKTMFEQEFKESKTNEIQLEMNAETLEEFLTFIYTGQTNFGSIEIAKALLAAGDVYFTEDLKTVAEDFLCESLDETNALDLLIASIKYTAPELRAKSWKFFGPSLGTTTDEL